jgi:hypothetical protein
VDLEEDLKEIPVRSGVGVINDLHRLGVIAVVVVGGVRGFPSGPDVSVMLGVIRRPSMNGDPHMPEAAPHAGDGGILSTAARTLWGTKSRVDVSGLEGVSRRLALTSRSDRELTVIRFGEHDRGC